MNAGMIFFEMDLLVEYPDFQLVLAAYHAEEQVVAEAHAEARKQAKQAAEAAEPEVIAQPDDCESLDGAPDDEVPTKTPADDFAESRWIARIMEVEGIPDEELSAIYGQLIAHGLLKFKLLGRDGMGYQLTSLGRRGAFFCPEHEQTDEGDEFSFISDECEAA